MSTKVKDNGGQAFPRTAFNDDGDVTTWDDEFLGMTLRDYFASKAVQGMLCEGYIPEQKVNYASYNGIFHEMYAEQAYKIADAMLKARQS